MQDSILRRAVVHRNTAENVFRAALRVLHLDVKIAAVVEDPRIDELVLKFVPGPGAVHRHEIGIRELGLRVLVEPALVAMRREVVDVEVVLLHILTMVALTVRQAKETLLQNRVPLVPQREGEAQSLLIITDPGQAIFTPPIRAGPRLIVTEI